MLTAEANALLTRIGPGTPMGDVLRRYWVPALLSDEIPDADGNPVRVKLLGEELVAFRDTNGSVGLVGEFFPHRGASLLYARNEENGLRCIYHGWKYDVDGTPLETPNESGDRGRVPGVARAPDPRCPTIFRSSANPRQRGPL